MTFSKCYVSEVKKLLKSKEKENAIIFFIVIGLMKQHIMLSC
jgi:hypothetical protein